VHQVGFICNIHAIVLRHRDNFTSAVNARSLYKGRHLLSLVLLSMLNFLGVFWLLHAIVFGMTALESTVLH